jgi:glucokinase
LAVLHALYLPEVTVIGGNAAQYLDLFKEGLLRAIARTPQFSVGASIRAAALGDEAGAIGAALIARDALD